MAKKTILLAGAFVLLAISLPGLARAQDFGRCCYGDTLDPDCTNLTIDECKALDDMISWYWHIRCEDLSCLDGCCVLAGDANCDGKVNILDASGIILYLYKSGPAPCCFDQADADGSNSYNVLDVTHIINYLYKNGPEPVCGTTGH